MVNNFAAASVQELEVLLESLFEGAARKPVRSAPGVYFGRDPILGHIVISNEDHSELRLLICRALVAGAKFRNEAPGWPELPLRQQDIATFVDDDDIRRSVTGLYADSLRAESWSPQHPGFGAYVGGLMACRSTPKHIRTDPELTRQFPPRRLKGITGGEWLTWRSPEALALDAEMRRMIAADEARMGA